jgi:hypothetical protein
MRRLFFWCPFKMMKNNLEIAINCVLNMAVSQLMVVSRGTMVDVDLPIFGSSLVKTENSISNLN